MTPNEPLAEVRSAKPKTLEQLAANPLSLVPKDWRRPLSWLWMCYSHLFPSSLPIAALLATWHRRGILHGEDVVPIFQKLTDPENAAKYRFQSDLLTDLAAFVAQAKRDREKSTETELVKAKWRSTGPASQDGRLSEEFAKIIANMDMEEG